MKTELIDYFFEGEENVFEAYEDWKDYYKVPITIIKVLAIIFIIAIVW